MVVGVLEPQDRYPSRGVPDVVADGPAAPGLGAPGQQGRPHRGDRRGVRRVEGELDRGDRGRVGVDRLLGGDLGDPSREVNVLLGHPIHNMLGASSSR